MVLSSLILGGSFYSIQINKQRSLERQQQINIQEKQREDKAKADQAKKEFTAKQKSDCLEIYKTENSKWNNVTGWRYDENLDACYVSYKDSKPKSAEECDKLYPTLPSGDVSTFYPARVAELCKIGEFEKPF